MNSAPKLLGALQIFEHSRDSRRDSDDQKQLLVQPELVIMSISYRSRAGYLRISPIRTASEGHPNSKQEKFNDKVTEPRNAKSPLQEPASCPTKRKDHACNGNTSSSISSRDVGHGGETWKLGFLHFQQDGPNVTKALFIVRRPLTILSSSVSAPFKAPLST